jgi:hypothetical protein
MKVTRLQSMSSVIAVLVSVFLFSVPSSAAVTRETSQQLTQLLGEARDEAFELATDADQTQSLILSDDNWVTHALMLARVKGHVDNMSLIIEKLTKIQKMGSELQEQAVDRMLPLVKELSANTTAAINYLNQNKDRPISDAYTQYLKRNAETAHQLSSIISALFEYQKSMSEIEQLRSNLKTIVN